MKLSMRYSQMSRRFVRVNPQMFEQARKMCLTAVGKKMPSAVPFITDEQILTSILDCALRDYIGPSEVQEVLDLASPDLAPRPSTLAPGSL